MSHDIKAIVPKARMKPGPKLHKKALAKITDSVVIRMCELLVNRLTDQEACAVLGIKQAVWSHWLGRSRDNSRKFTQTFARIRGNLISECMEGIRKAGVKDFRALDRLLERVDRDRFGDRMPMQTVQIGVSVFSQSDAKAIAARVYSEQYPQLPQASDDKPLVVSAPQSVV